MNRDEITVVALFAGLMLSIGVAVAILWLDASARVLRISKRGTYFMLKKFRNGIRTAKPMLALALNADTPASRRKSAQDDCLPVDTQRVYNPYSVPGTAFAPRASGDRRGQL